jgi:hypothetical protein
MAALISIVAAGALASIGGLWLVRHLVPMAVLVANNEVAGNYLQTLGTIYAVLLAFVVFIVWTQFNDARNAVAVEANEISDLYRTVDGFADPARGSVHSCLSAYVAHVAAAEWPEMSAGAAIPRASPKLDALWAALEVLEPKTPREEILLAEALARFNDLSDRRTHRLFCSQLRLPPTMWLLLHLGAFLTVASMAFFGLPSFASHALMTSALSGLIGFMLYVILDLDNPFWGSWCIPAEQFRDAIAFDPASARRDGAG